MREFGIKETVFTSVHVVPTGEFVQTDVDFTHRPAKFIGNIVMIESADEHEQFVRQLGRGIDFSGSRRHESLPVCMSVRSSTSRVCIK